MTTYSTHLVFLHTRQDYWREYGHCSNLGSKIMFPFHAEKQQKVADTVCYQCPVQHQCLTLALHSRDANGVWGGTTEPQRELLDRFVGPIIEAWDVEAIKETQAVALIDAVVNAAISMFTARVFKEQKK